MYFPGTVVQVMQHDALERLNLREMLLQPEMLETMQPDVHLVASLISLSGVIPATTKDTARMVVRKVVDALMKKLEEPMRSAVTGALDRSRRNRRPRHSDIDWNRTIRANLKHWQPDYRTIVPEQLISYGRKARTPQREVVHRPERLDGGVGGVFEHFWRSSGLTARRGDQAGGV